MTTLHAARRRWVGIAVVLAALPLAACFDLTQHLSIDRGGSGHYDMAITANGLLGEALKDNKAPIHVGSQRMKTHVSMRDGKVTQTGQLDFKTLSDLHLSDESLSLSARGSSWFGLGPNHVTFRRTLLVDRARRENMRGRGDNDRLGTEMLQTMFGDHIYSYSVTVPGSVERANTLQLGTATVRPQISGSGMNHTVTWRMPLYDLLRAKLLRFEVDFSAYGSFRDAQSLPG